MTPTSNVHVWCVFGVRTLGAGRVTVHDWLWNGSSRPVDTWVPLVDAQGAHAGVVHLELQAGPSDGRPATAPTFHATVPSLKARMGPTSTAVKGVWAVDIVVVKGGWVVVCVVVDGERHVHDGEG
jgi:hypothetical protein